MDFFGGGGIGGGGGGGWAVLGDGKGIRRECKELMASAKVEGFITASSCQKLQISAMLGLNEMHGHGASLFQHSGIGDIVSPCNAIIVITQNCCLPSCTLTG